MGKWWWTPFFIVLLVGCSISIDPQQSDKENQETATSEQQEESANQENDTQSDLNSEQQTVSQEVEEDNEEAEESATSTFTEIVEGIFQIELPFTNKGESVSYLALGDSLTRGVGDERDQYGYTGRLSDVLEEWPEVSEVVLDNRGKNGRRSDQLLALLKRGHYDEELQSAQFISVSVGGNDLMKIIKKDLLNLKLEMFEKEVPAYHERYKEIVEEIRKRNADVPIMLVGFYNPFLTVTDEPEEFDIILNSFNGAIEQVAESDVNACFVPVDDLFETDLDMVYHTDFFHPNAKGYENMTKRIIETLQDCDIESMSDGALGIRE